MDNLLTVPEVAREKGVSRTAVLIAVSEGRIPAVRAGRIWLIRRADADAYAPRAYRRRPARTRRVPDAG